MGAWGVGTFEDDSSLDLIDEWMEAEDPISLIEADVRQALASDYMDYTQGIAISVVAAILDYKLNVQPTTDADIDGLDEWLLTLDYDRLNALRPDVVRAVDVLIGPESELAELWAENEELFPAWQKILQDRKARLLVS